MSLFKAIRRVRQLVALAPELASVPYKGKGYNTPVKNKTIGDPVMIYWPQDKMWHPALIQKLNSNNTGLHLVRWTGGSTGIYAAKPEDIITMPPVKPDQRVLAFIDGDWWEAKVTKVEGQTVHVLCDGYEDDGEYEVKEPHTCVPQPMKMKYPAYK